MGGGLHFLDIIFFAVVAVFLVLRLRSVLGRRTGNERPPSDPFTLPPAREPGADDKVIRLPERNRRPATGEPSQPATAEPAQPLSPRDQGLAAIRAADGGFVPEEFLKGARAAFEMIVAAYAAGDTKTLRPLLAGEVYDNFAQAIKERQANGQTLKTDLVGIKSTEIEAARMEGASAMVTIRFVSEQANALLDGQGKVIEGDPNQIATVVDLWTFARDTRSRDPNWALVETGTPD
ncbi:MAG: Tim44 domain-containing protein [Rhodospirillales bacterium]|nr:Tim44 domain-containing protein [Rhodospirillales bacterium]